jgi:fucose permease
MGSLGVMPAYREYFKLSTALVSANIAMGFVGGIVIALVAGPVVDHKGRKFGILLACMCQICGAILQGAARHIAMFLVGM